MTSTTCKQKQVDIIDITETETDYFYYRGQQLVNIIQGQGRSQPGQRFFQTVTGLAAQMNVGGNVGTWLIGADALGSVLAGSDGKDAPEEHCYTPYGGEKRQGAMESVMKLGYTGAYRDPLTGLYPLGNGYRCYLPELMCFNKADSLSPFGAGGINTRSYCGNDPINNSDPSGHIGEGLGKTMVEVAAAVTAGLVDPALDVVIADEVLTEVMAEEITEEAFHGAIAYFDSEDVTADLDKKEEIDKIAKELRDSYETKSPVRSTEPKTKRDLASPSSETAPKRPGDDLGGPSTKRRCKDPEIVRQRNERQQQKIKVSHYDDWTVRQFVEAIYGPRDLPGDMAYLEPDRNYARYILHNQRPDLLNKISPDISVGEIKEGMLTSKRMKALVRKVQFTINLMEYGFDTRMGDATFFEPGSDGSRFEFSSMFINQYNRRDLWM